MQVDINCDMGESFGVYRIGNDEEMMKCITSANIGCGYHAGDPMVMDRTVKLAVQHGVQVGCHFGYPDLMGFGRRNLEVSPAEMRNYLLYQLGALWAFARAHGTEVRHAAGHGPIGASVSGEWDIAMAIAEAVASFSKEIIVVCVAGTELVLACKELGLRVAEQAYADRAYNADGSLQSRKIPGSVIHDPEVAAERAVRMVRDGIVVAHSGELVKVQADTIVVHGETPGAPLVVAAVRAALQKEGVQVRPMAEYL